MKIETRKVRNGDMICDFYLYQCNECKCELDESMPMYEDESNDIHYCCKCAFIKGLVSEKYYLNYGLGVSLPNYRAGIHPVTKEIEIAMGRKAKLSWEKPDKCNDYRQCPQYKEWRGKVYKRDNYTCQHCNSNNGHLNAHHIIPYAKNEELRFELSNGITLCEECHKAEHRRLRELKNNVT